MHKYAILLPLFLATALAAASPQNQQQALAEKEREVARQVALCPVKADPALVDAGFVKPHTELKLEAKLTNSLDRPVTCIKSVPSCTCTTVDMVGKTIPARGSITMPVAMKTSGATGEKTATVMLVFEGVPGAVEIKLRAEVAYEVRGYQVNPGRDGKPAKDPFINAYDIKSNIAGVVVVESLDGKPFRVLSVAGAPPVFADFDPATQPARAQYQVRYDFSKLECAQVPPYLLIETDRPDSRLVDMRVRHECTRLNPAFHFEQYRDNLGVIAPGATKDFEVVIKMANGVRIDSVVSADPRLEAQLVGSKADEDSMAALVRVRAMPGATGVMMVPLRFTGVGPDPRMPVQPGLPVATQPRTANYLVYLKVEAAAPSNSKAAPDPGTPRAMPAAVRDAILAPAAQPPADRVQVGKITQLDDPSVPARVVQPLPVVQRIAARAEEVPIAPENFARARAAVERALGYLRTTQGSEGGWMESTRATATDQSKPSPAVGSAVTGLILKAFAQAGHPLQSDAAVKRALAYVVKQTQLGGDFQPDPAGGLANYVASLVLMGLAAQQDPQLADEVQTIVSWLKDNQWQQASGIGPRADWFGGAGYGNHGRPDLSNTQLMLDALHDAGVSPEDPAVQRALVFVSRTQNLKQSNPAAWAQAGNDDGGFVYTPANGGESMASDAAGEGRSGEKMPPGSRSLRSYGSMTYAGFKSMLYAGLAPEDPRVRAAFDWIRRHYTFDENPGLGAQGHYYFLHATARALYAANARSIEPLGANAPSTSDAGAPHAASASRARNWRDDLVEALLLRQRPDGSWVNSADRWQEGQPDLTTAYAVLALEEALKPVWRVE